MGNNLIQNAVMGMAQTAADGPLRAAQIYGMAGASFEKGASLAMKMDLVLKNEEQRLINNQLQAQKMLEASLHNQMSEQINVAKALMDAEYKQGMLGISKDRLNMQRDAYDKAEKDRNLTYLRQALEATPKTVQKQDPNGVVFEEPNPEYTRLNKIFKSLALEVAGVGGGIKLEKPAAIQGEVPGATVTGQQGTGAATTGINVSPAVSPAINTLATTTPANTITGLDINGRPEFTLNPELPDKGIFAPGGEATLANDVKASELGPDDNLIPLDIARSVKKENGGEIPLAMDPAAPAININGNKLPATFVAQVGRKKVPVKTGIYVDKDFKETKKQSIGSRYVYSPEYVVAVTPVDKFDTVIEDYMRQVPIGKRKDYYNKFIDAIIDLKVGDQKADPVVLANMVKQLGPVDNATISRAEASLRAKGYKKLSHNFGTLMRTIAQYSTDPVAAAKENDAAYIKEFGENADKYHFNPNWIGNWWNNGLTVEGREDFKDGVTYRRIPKEAIEKAALQDILKEKATMGYSSTEAEMKAFNRVFKNHWNTNLMSSAGFDINPENEITGLVIKAIGDTNTLTKKPTEKRIKYTVAKDLDNMVEQFKDYLALRDTFGAYDTPEFTVAGQKIKIPYKLIEQVVAKHVAAKIGINKGE